MSIVMTIIAVLLIIGLIYYTIHRLLVNRATIMLRNSARDTTDAAVRDSLRQLLSNDKLTLQTSEQVADVWGKGVMAFEYSLDMNQLGFDLGKLNVAKLNQALKSYAKKNGIQPVEGAKDAFVVSDWWTYEQLLHIDVAYVMNEATKEYVLDLKKVAKSQHQSIADEHTDED